MHARLIGALFLATATVACGNDKSTRGPRPPSGLTATAGDGMAILTWIDEPDAERYIVYIAREPGIEKDTYDELDGGYRFTGEDIASPFEIGGLDNGTTYFFVVTSVSEENYEGRESGEVWTSPTPWGTPDILETLPGEAIGLAAAVDPTGNIHAVWARGEGPSRQAIHTQRWDAGTQTWGGALTLDTGAGISGSPSVAAFTDGDAIAVWRQGTGTDDRVWGAAFDAVNGWDPPFPISNAGASAARNPLAVGMDDDAFVVWTQGYVATGGGIVLGVYAAVNENETGFGAPQQLDVAGTSAESVRLAAGGGRVHAAWVQSDLVWLDEWSAGSWAGAQMLATTSDEPLSVRIASNEDGDAVLVWREQNLSTDLYAKVFDPVSGTWGESSFVESSALDALDPALAVCPGGEAIAVFTQRAGLHHRLVASRWDPLLLEWTEPAIVHESPEGDAEAPHVVVDADCNAIVVWIQEVVSLGGPGTTRNVYSTYNLFETPDAWEDPLLVGGYGLSSSPLVTVDADGDVMALWEFYGASGEEIWFNRLGD